VHARGTRRGPEDDLFSVDPAAFISHSLAGLTWPDQGRFPVNHARTTVRGVVEDDLTSSSTPLLIAGYSSIGSLVDFIAAWARAGVGARSGPVRLLLGSEPFGSTRAQFASAQEEFTEEIRQFWLERSVSVRLSAKVVRAIQALDQGALQVRVVPGPTHLHAKIYLGENAATVGSSNFTNQGMSRQLEANARFERATEPTRFKDLITIGDNLWSKGQRWNTDFRQLLLDLLQVVPWQEAVARACGELLEGGWAEALGLLSADGPRSQLWPSQTAGIAQALWVVENLGSVLVADATGSGKTRMGAHLVAAVRNRLWDTGRMRRDRDLTTLVCPPAVQDTWKREALASGVTIMPVSHGLLSRPDPYGPRNEATAVARAQVLAVDEAHNFLAADSNRTRHIRDTVADHVLLFTATPISRGAQDLLSLVGLLGADNFDDSTLDVLERLDRRARPDEALTEVHRQRLRQEIQRFTVRRTKSSLNRMVERDEEAYRHPDTGRICRYPRHLPRLYTTGETTHDQSAAEDVRAAAASLHGLIQLGRRLGVPDTLRGEVTDPQWLTSRLNAARGLARHQVLAALRSSRAALIEHVAGTAAAVRTCDLPSAAKSQASGDLRGKVVALADDGPPMVELECELPDWLRDESAWRRRCAEEVASYDDAMAAAQRLSEAREQRKAQLLAELAREHRLVLAFDRHPITLAAVNRQLSAPGVEVLVATGDASAERKRVEKLFARSSEASAIALCSDAMNEGLNLQGAAALVHLDLPTTLRVAEQRVGRLDRMDSPHDQISVWWPKDGPSFATRATELLLSRRQASESLLGSNMPMPALDGRDDQIVRVEEHIQEFERPDAAWDGVLDALDPVRQLVEGDDALVSAAVYAEHRHTRHRVAARVAPVEAETPWAFLALAGTRHGAPRWLLLEGHRPQAHVGLEAVTERLRRHLHGDPPGIDFDDTCEQWLDLFLTAAARAEDQLLPRRMQRALEQMAVMTERWAKAATRDGNHETAIQWRRLHRLARPGTDEEERLDLYLVAETWWDIVRPLFAEVRRSRGRRRYTRLRDLDGRLSQQALDLGAVQEAMRRVPISEPVDRRVSAVILGVPAPRLEGGT
jgi:hypothetical protein